MESERLPASKPALLIIDMQKGMIRDEADRTNNPAAENEVAQLLSDWRRARAPVIHVRHISRAPGSRFWPGQEGVEFQRELEPRANEHVVEKNVPDAFVHTGLERWLHARGIRKLVVVGVSTNNSIEASVRSAGNLGFETTVASDATFAFAKVDYSGVERTAEEVHAMSLANLQGEYALVLTAAEIRQLLLSEG